MRHGSAACARYPSLRMITGVMYFVAIRTASIAISKQSAVDTGASTASGASALRPCTADRSEEHTSELQSRSDLVCRLLLEKKKKHPTVHAYERTRPALSRQGACRLTALPHDLSRLGLSPLY